jgi:hypothetical protein
MRAEVTHFVPQTPEELGDFFLVLESRVIAADAYFHKYVSTAIRKRFRFFLATIDCKIRRGLPYGKLKI